MSTENPEEKPVEETAEAPAAEETTSTEEAAAAPAAEETATTEDAPAEEATESVAEGLEIGSTATAVADEVDPDFEPVVRGKIDKFGVAMGTGRRKTAVARVRVQAGKGKFTVNGKELTEFFPVERDQKMILAVLEKTEKTGKVDVWTRVSGGGITGQTGAVVLGLARALQVMDPSLHEVLSDNGFLTRDPRMVERKKYGFKKARKSFQFSKR
ncbi:MAG: 30S ribosomal protein S9 [Planctomycetaceae bacterium]|nr:30S ribosomal protein S9 [Planctomycetaceae bacterium]